jgi:hypothetical protein
MRLWRISLLILKEGEHELHTGAEIVNASGNKGTGVKVAVLNGIEIINLRIEGPDAQGLHDACNYVYNAGVLLVAAGGNSPGG